MNSLTSDQIAHYTNLLKQGILPDELTLESVDMNIPLTQLEKLAWAQLDDGRHWIVVDGKSTYVTPKVKMILQKIARKVKAKSWLPEAARTSALRRGIY